MSRDIIVGRPAEWNSPSYHAVIDFVDAAVSTGMNQSRLKLWPRAGQIYRRLGSPPMVAATARARRRILTPMMGPRWDILAAASLIGQPVIYAWDVWQPAVGEWVEMAMKHHAESVICTSKMAADAIRARVPAGVRLGVNTLPEAMNLNEFPETYKCLEARRIDVLELGRRHESWHSAAREGNADCVWLFELTTGSLVFKSRNEMVAGLGGAKISVCFPRAVTHPEVAGSFSTMTLRYLESFAAGCVVLGACPPELVDLFGYNPVVPVDQLYPAQQVRDILANISEYQKLVDANANRVREVGTWDARMHALLNLI